MECITSLVGLRELCVENTPPPLFYLDDAEGLDRQALSQLAKSSDGSGKAFGLKIIESSSRFLISDIETLIPKGYTIKSSLNSFCNVCTYTSLAAQSAGVKIKNTSASKNSYLSIDSLKVKIQNTGVFTVVLDDDVTLKSIPVEFTAGVEVSIINISYKTTSSSVKIYFAEAEVLSVALSCPIQKSCGCSGSTKQSKDIQIVGLLNGSEFTTQYGFIPCASVVCSIDNLICAIVNQQPRLFAVSLFYRTCARYFAEFATTQRNNTNASFGEKEKLELADYYYSLYNERLRGSRNIKGIADNMAAVLNNINDPCVECNRFKTVSWAIG